MNEILWGKRRKLKKHLWKRKEKKKKKMYLNR